MIEPSPPVSTSPANAYYLELRDVLREYLDEQQDPSLTWVDAYREVIEHLTAEDYRWAAELDWRAKQARRYSGRVAYARPAQEVGRRRQVVPRRVRRFLIATCPWCIYCGGAATTIDHIWPWIDGGTNDVRNLAPCCKRCNSGKRDKLFSEWRDYRRSTGRSWPPEPHLPTRRRR